MTNNIKSVRRGDIYYADLRAGVVGSEQGGIRPVLIVQNDLGNKYSPTTIIVTITSKTTKNEIPTHVNIDSNAANGLKTDSIALCEQFRTIDKSRLKNRVGHVDDNTLNSVLNAVKVSLAI